MRDDDEETDDDAQEELAPRRRRRKPPFPATVMAAGVVWIGFGCLILVLYMFELALLGNNPKPNPNSWTSCCHGLFGVAFLVCGFQTVNGKTSDTIGNGIGSIAFGLLNAVVGLVLGLGGVNLAGNNAFPAAAAIGLISLAIAALLIMAGALALIGRTAYLDWREANAPRRRRPRRRRVRYEDNEDDEDDDDEYRRRRRR